MSNRLLIIYLIGNEPDYWTNGQKQAPEVEVLIEEINAEVGQT